MPVSPAMAEDLAAAVTMLYEDAELALIEILRDALAQGIDSPRWAELKLRSIGDLREAVETVANALQQDANGAVAEALATAYGRGRQAAVAELGALDIGRELHARRILPGAPAVDRLAASYANDTRPLYQRITRSVLDVFRGVTSRAAGTQLLTGITRRDASQRALDEFARRGVTGFIDSAGRAWELAAYAEMTVRSVTARAAIDGHIDAMAEVGQGLVIVSDAPLECPKCAPWEGEVLALAGPPGPRTVRTEQAIQPTGLRGVFRAPTTVAVHLAGTLPEARAAGLFHPNAILGNQQCRVLGELENAAQAWYEGPSIHLTTARGKRLTVSPNHPVLTTAGWLAAERVREGMHVLSGPGVEGDEIAAPAAEDLDDAPTGIQEVFDALAAQGVRTSVAASGNDFHGDGRSYKGEVSVVWAERALLDVLEPLSVEQGGELELVGASVELEPLAGSGPLFPCGHRVGGAVARSLPDLYAVGLQTSPQRRLADAEDLDEILAGLACGVSTDQVVNVERDWYRGHAYDLQTSTGAYLTADIAVHNCRHSLGLYLPGVTTRPPQHPTPGTTYADTQRQREIERHIRRWKRAEAAAMDETARAKAAAKVRDWQKAAREHVAAHDAIVRKPAREQIGRAH
ncbi:phage minor capsid protein [Streptomyces sp. NPDC059949]|uniref:phage minor capsid protein n=1 Tax=Streptomyces sp. NPDC059949 TaxID=3347013 RepID=UPI00364697C4